MSGNGKICTNNRLCLAILPAAIAAALAGIALSADAFEIDTGNPDIAMSWNNTLRYNWAQRMQGIDEHVALAGPAAGATYSGYAAGDNLFKKGDTITNRLDVLSELNFVYADKYGFRVSAAAWYDNAYSGKHPTPDPASGLPVAGTRTTSYQNNEFTDYVKRYYEGPSGEWLDAYVFGNFEIADTNLNVRLGRHSVVWGEGLIGSNHSIAYSQAPSDSRKAVSSPGASAKETALPVDQVSATAAINPEFTLLAHYQFEWIPNRLPEGATYFAGADVLQSGPNINRSIEFKRGENGGYGLGLKWSPEWLDGTLGFYYRKFDDKGGGWAAQPTGGFGSTAVWAKDIELYGASLSKNIAGVSVGAEVSYRKNDALTSSTTATAGATNRFEGARGNTWHAVLNGIQTFGHTSFFDSASLVGELAWAKLDRLTKNNVLYRQTGYSSNCTPSATNFPNIRGCVTGDYLGPTLTFTANWLQVYPGIDLAMPLLYQTNFGNSPSAGGGSDGFTTYKVGLTATAWIKSTFDLSYTWWDQKVDRSTPFSVPGFGTYGRLLGAPYSDKGFLSFTYQYAF